MGEEGRTPVGSDYPTAGTGGARFTRLFILPEGLVLAGKGWGRRVGPQKGQIIQQLGQELGGAVMLADQGLHLHNNKHKVSVLYIRSRLRNRIA
jgi:hypothetical protein